MKNLFLTFPLTAICYCALAQTNTFPSSGSVGVGTTAPRALLDVHSGTSLVSGDAPGTSVITSPNQTLYQGTLSLESNSAMAADQGGTLIFKGIYSSNNPAAFAAIGGFKENGTDNNCAGYLAFFSRTNGGFNGERMRISSTGNVGIGTTTPNGKLDINGSFLLTSYNNTTPRPAVGSTRIPSEISAYSSQGLAADDGFLRLSAGGGTNASITKSFIDLSGYSTVPDMNRNVVLGTAGTERMRIDINGNVSIGTSNPQGYMLAVNGTAIATSMTVKLNANWPDYVFKPNYNLPSLTEVKTYIDKNQHLPEMPSEHEIAKDGLNLGEMNRLLVKKVEELTLYLIEKDKEIKHQQNLNSTQKDKLIEFEKRLEKLETRRKGNN